MKSPKKLFWSAGHWGLIMWRIWMSRIFRPILVFSMAKSGTTSVKVSLRSRLRLNPVFHIHHLSWSYIEEMKSRAHLLKAQDVASLNEKIQIREFIDSTRGRIRWKVVCLTRDPVGREISTVFENPERKGLDKLAGQELHEKVSVILNELVEYKSLGESHWSSLSWFDWELQDVFGFDALAVPFDHAAGYQIYSVKDADILIVRLEDLSRCASQAFGEFLGLKDFHLQKANESAGKLDKQIYQHVLATVSLPEAWLDKYYTSRYAQHFYTPEEIQAFRQRWRGKNS